MGRLVIHEERPLANRLYWKRRFLGLTALDQIRLKELKPLIKKYLLVILMIKDNTLDVIPAVLEASQIMLTKYCSEFRSIIRVPYRLNEPLPKVKSLNRRISSFDDMLYQPNFRFKSQLQVHQLIICFRMPTWLFSKWGHRFHIEELLLVVLFYLHYPEITTDMTFECIFGWPSYKVNLGIKIFFTWFVSNWSYLIYDNMRFWVNNFPFFANKIRQKLCSIDCDFSEESGFNVCGFIDNTVYATQTPGGGPTTAGPDSPRYHPLIQQSFYNGWKGIHGIKWQTMSLPNGKYATL